MSLLCNVSENEINLNSNELGHKRQGSWRGRGVGSNMMADDCAQVSLQARPNESLNVCE